MKVVLDGFGLHADTLYVSTLKRFTWQGVTSVLNIPGVRYYHVQAGAIGLRYTNGLVDPRDVAAQAIRVVAEACDAILEEVVVAIRDHSIDDVKALLLADEVWQRTLSGFTPPEVPVAQVIARGTGPAYWLG